LETVKDTKCLVSPALFFKHDAGRKEKISWKDHVKNEALLSRVKKEMTL
jgi:hypothetical protein